MIKWRELTGGASSFNSTSLSELSRRSQNVIVTQSRGEVKYESVESPKLEKDCRGGSAVLDAPFIWIFEHCLARPKWHEGGRNKKREMDAYRRPPRFKCSLTRFWLKDVLINIRGRERRLRAILLFGLADRFRIVLFVAGDFPSRLLFEGIARSEKNLDEFITKGKERLLTIMRDGDREARQADIKRLRKRAIVGGRKRRNRLWLC